MNLLASAFLACLAASAAALLAAEPAKVYQPVGAPADPKVPAQWNRYHDYESASKLLADLAAAHPRRCRLTSLGKSHGNRDMWLLTISDFSAGAEPHRPAMWIDGGIHANEIQGPEVVLYTAWYLLENADRVAKIKALLDQRTFYLAPMLSPDSRDHHFYKPNTTHSPRSGLRPIDDDNDGLTDEDGFDDLNADGHITQMRIADPNGAHKPHDEFPNLMVRVKPGEKGVYRLLGFEGVDNDGDGRINEDGPGSYDPNRDFAWNWQPGYVQNGAFRYPFSLRENRAIADFILAHANIAAAQSYHNAGGMILRGPGVKEDSYSQQDLQIFEAIGRKGELMLPGYKYLTIHSDLYTTYGVEVDWLYQMRGVTAFTNELWTAFNYFRKASDTPGYFGSDEDAHTFNRYLLLDDGFTPWKPVDHPHLGRIEVGGFKKNWIRQPPSFLLEEECHRNMAFSLHHADQMPLVRIQSATIQPLDGGLRQVTAIIENQRLIPTRLRVDVQHKITLPDRVSIAAPSAKVIAALIDEEPFFRTPREQKLDPATVKLDAVGGHDVVYVRWLIAGDGPVEVRIDSVKGGSDVMNVLGGK
jgi:hypothetical protein